MLIWSNSDQCSTTFPSRRRSVRKAEMADVFAGGGQAAELACMRAAPGGLRHHQVTFRRLVYDFDLDLAERQR